MLNNIDHQQCINLLIGMCGVYTFYLSNAVFHEQLIKNQFSNHYTHQKDLAIYCPQGLVAISSLFSYIFARFYNKRIIKSRLRVYIPKRNGFFCGLCVFVSTFTYTHAAFKTSFPVVMVFKSSSVLSVLLVAIFFSRVKQASLKITSNKLITGFFLTLGVFLFNFFDPQTTARNNKSQLVGILLLIISLISDGLLPDFQAQIKSIYKPQPSEMLEQVNKWVTIIGGVVLVINNFSIIDYTKFLIFHHYYTFLLVIYSILAFIGQMFIYRLIKQFRQHIVPFVVTSRKIMTVLISVFFLNHQYNYKEFIGILIIFFAATFQFISQLKISQKKTEKFQKVTDWRQIQKLTEVANTSDRSERILQSEGESQVIKIQKSNGDEQNRN